MIDNRTLSGRSGYKKDLRRSVDTYLRGIFNTVPDSTYFSQQTHLSAFLRWYHSKSPDTSTPLEELIVQHLCDVLAASGLALMTLRDRASTLVNLLVYHQPQDPEVAKQKLSALLLESSTSDCQRLAKQISSDSVSDALQSHIQALQSFLEQRQYGTRTHAYVELLLDTKCRPKQIRQVDRADLDPQTCELSVNVPNTHLVSTAGLVTEYSLSISETTIESLETYIEYERTEISGSVPKPLFTTTHGRASSTALRRSVKQASEDTIQFQSHCSQSDSLRQTGSESEQDPQLVSPTDIWQYSLSTHREDA